MGQSSTLERADVTSVTSVTQFYLRASVFVCAYVARGTSFSFFFVRGDAMSEAQGTNQTSMADTSSCNTITSATQLCSQLKV